MLNRIIEQWQLTLDTKASPCLSEQLTWKNVPLTGDWLLVSIKQVLSTSSAENPPKRDEKLL
jgi:hypothetical protein